MNKPYAILAGAALLALSGAACAQSAMEELRNANSGSQSTGRTFDNSRQPQTTDAYPRGQTITIETPRSSSSTYNSGSSSGTHTSSGTASGYSTGTSSGTASGSRPTRRGSESTR